MRAGRRYLNFQFVIWLSVGLVAVVVSTSKILASETQQHEIVDKADTLAENMAPYVLCRQRKVIRTIRVEKSGDKERCETVYTKSGVDRSVGSGIHLASCRQFAENIRRNLEVANWKCQDISAKASISNSPSDLERKTE